MKYLKASIVSEEAADDYKFTRPLSKTEVIAFLQRNLPE